MIDLQLLGIGLIGPGLDGWRASIPLLKDAGNGYRPGETVIPVSRSLSPNERRRTTPTIKLAMAAAEQAADDAGIEPGSLATIFASSLGDMQIADNLCRALAREEKPVSPTQFHNSVHNAPAGYWSIAVGSRCASTSLAVAEAGFPAALLEAALQSQATGQPTMVVVYDSPAPVPLDAVAPVADAFAVAMVVQAGVGNPTIGLALGDGKATALENQALERVRLCNPAARALPLLQAIAEGEVAEVSLSYLDRQLLVELAAS